MNEINIPLTVKQAKIIGTLLGFSMLLPMMFSTMNPIVFVSGLVGIVILAIVIPYAILDWLFSHELTFKK